MDAIKKKMQGMKLEKDNAMDRALLCEQQARDANARAEKVKFIIAASINSSKTSLWESVYDILFIIAKQNIIHA